ncbi:MAG: type II toxin-antitoxin system VapC family toxin [Acidimicrobiales bacterium]
MKLYLDSSALVKLVKREAESDALRRYLRKRGTDNRVTSALARVEVVRAVAGGGAVAVAHAWRQLARIDQINLDRELLDLAATLAPGVMLRSLDAVHLAAARSIGSDLGAVLTYDRRMQDAAGALGLLVDAPC